MKNTVFTVLNTSRLTADSFLLTEHCLFDHFFDRAVRFGFEDTEHLREHIRFALADFVNNPWLGAIVDHHIQGIQVFVPMLAPDHSLFIITVRPSTLAAITTFPLRAQGVATLQNRIIGAFPEWFHRRSTDAWISHIENIMQ